MPHARQGLRPIEPLQATTSTKLMLPWCQHQASQEIGQSETDRVCGEWLKGTLVVYSRIRSLDEAE
jgi:hypothetical protein